MSNQVENNVVENTELTLNTIDFNEFADLDAELNVSAENEAILDDIISKMLAVTGDKEFYPQLDFKQSKLVGIIRLLIRNYTHRNKLCEIVGVPQSFVQRYNQAFGTPTYIDKKTNNVIAARPMDIEQTKKLTMWLAHKLGLTLLVSDFDDFNDNHIKDIYSRAEVRTKDTAELNAQIANEHGMTTNPIAGLYEE